MTRDEFEPIARSFNPGQETWWHFEVGSMSTNFVRLLALG
jgi:hypothetical protein